MVWFGMKTKSNQIELFDKFKITEPNRLHFEPNRIVIIGTIEKP